MNHIAENLAAVKARIDQAADAAGRDPCAVTLVAISKTKPAELIVEAFAPDIGCSARTGFRKPR